MAFSVLSLLVSFFSQISRACQSRNVREKRFLNVDRATLRMTIKCGDLKSHHAFSHQKIEQCLQDVFDTNESLADLHHRKDVSLSMEVISIKELTKTKQSLIVIFESVILTQDQSNANNTLKGLILDNIKNIGENRHINNTEMTNVCAVCCNCLLRFITKYSKCFEFVCHCC